MKSGLARHLQNILDKQDRDKSWSKIQEHSQNLSNRNSQEKFSQHESKEVSLARLSLERMKESQHKISIHRSALKNNSSSVEYGGGLTDRSVSEQPMFKWQSDTLQVKSTQISGWLRKTVQSVKLFQKTQFPLRFYVVNTKSKRLYIFEKPGGQLKQDMPIHGIKCVTKLTSESEEAQSYLRSNNNSKVISNLPNDFAVPFAVFLKDQMLFLWAKNAEECALWRQALGQLVEPNDYMPSSSAEVAQKYGANNSFQFQVFSELTTFMEMVDESPLKEDIIEQPDETQATLTARHRQEAAMSQETHWLTNLLQVFTTPSEKRSETMFEKIRQLNESAAFQSRRSIIEEVTYESSNCFQTDYVIMGFVRQPREQQEQKDEQFLRVKINLTPSDQFDTYFCAINFNIRKFGMVKMLTDNQPSDVMEQFLFTDLKTVQGQQSTIRDRQQRERRLSNGSSAANQCTWASELKLITKAKSLPLLLIATKKERQIWLSEFSRAIEWSDSSSPAKVSRKKQPTIAKPTQEMENAGRAQVMKARKEQIVQEIEQMEPAQVEGLSNVNISFFCYKNFVTGIVRVKVSNFESILRTHHNYPIQHLKLILKLNGSSFYLSSDKEKDQTKLKISTLEKVTFKEQAEQEEERVDIANQKGNKTARRSSIGRLFNKMLGNKLDETEISTRFGFELKTIDKTYTMFTSSKEEALVWEQVINSIIQMNKKGISIDKVNPFDFQKWLQLKKAKTESKNPYQNTQDKLSQIIKNLQSTEKTIEQDDGPVSSEAKSNVNATEQARSGSPKGAEETKQGTAANINLTSGGPNGLALKLENCNVQQIFIHVNDSSQLSTLGLSLPSHQKIQPRQPQTTQATTQPTIKPLTPVQVQKTPQKQVANHSTEPEPTSLQSMPNPQLISSLKVPVAIEKEQVMITGENQTRTVNKVVRRIRQRQMHSAQRKEIRIQNEKTGLSSKQIQIRTEQSKNELFEEMKLVVPLGNVLEAARPISCLKLKKSSLKVLEMNTPNGDNEQRQRAQSIQGQYRAKNRKIIRKKINSNLKQLVRVSSQATEEQQQQLQEETSQQSRTMKCISQILKKQHENQTSKMQLSALDVGRNGKIRLNKNWEIENNMHSTYPCQNTAGVGDETQQLNVTSSDILKSSGMTQKQKEDAYSLNKLLPTFQIKPTSLLTNNDRFIRHPQYTSHCNMQTEQSMRSSANTFTTTPLGISASRQIPTKMNFEQLIENQRDFNFLDRLIAEGDSKYGGTMSSQINSQFNEQHSNRSQRQPIKATTSYQEPRQDPRQEPKQEYPSQKNNAQKEPTQQKPQENLSPREEKHEDQHEEVWSNEISDWDEQSQDCNRFPTSMAVIGQKSPVVVIKSKKLGTFSHFNSPQNLAPYLIQLVRNQVAGINHKQTTIISSRLINSCNGASPAQTQSRLGVESTTNRSAYKEKSCLLQNAIGFHKKRQREAKEDDKDSADEDSEDQLEKPSIVIEDFETTWD